MGGAPGSVALNNTPKDDVVDDPDRLAEILAKKGYRIGKCIGEGSYCKVKVAVQSVPGGRIRRLACKVIDTRLASPEFVTKFLPRELRVVRSLRHPNVVSLLDVVEIGPRVFLFMELCERGDLLEWIRRRGALPESRARLFFSQLVSAVDYLHTLDIAHRDLKCENVLLTARPAAGVRLADFGFARLCRDRFGRRTLSTTFCGSAAYAAPEILQGNPYNPKLYDMWSLGCVLFIMLTASMPFDDSNVPRMLRTQLTRRLHFPRGSPVSNAAHQLIMHLLEPDVTQRANIRQAGRAPWLWCKSDQSAENRVFSAGATRYRGNQLAAAAGDGQAEDVDLTSTAGSTKRPAASNYDVGNNFYSRDRQNRLPELGATGAAKRRLREPLHHVVPSLPLLGSHNIPLLRSGHRPHRSFPHHKSTQSGSSPNFKRLPVPAAEKVVFLPVPVLQL